MSIQHEPPGLSEDGPDARNEQSASGQEAAPEAAMAEVIQSVHLLRGRNQVWIAHGSERYSLRRTRTGKLILTK
jgi:hemin uptake protein HemP